MLNFIAKREVNHVKGSSKRFHMESHTMRFHPQTQKLQSGIAERANYKSAFENCQLRGEATSGGKRESISHAWPLSLSV